MTVDPATTPDSDHAAAVRRLVDKEEILALLTRYTYLCDAREGTAWIREIFTEDGTDDHNLFGQAFQGWDAIESMFARSSQNLDATAHFISNTEIEVDGDRAKARTYTQCWTWLRASRDQGAVRPCDYVYVGVYNDDLVRTENGWRIKYRKMTPLGTGALGIGTGPETYFAGYAAAAAERDAQ
ncbi:nuclear transport factor 2 family protein [Nocardia miyunensis]|uniref:nuclear transport factor 2 family protein n=1 Tax=Nocardia miyunensis TaxID=282684 RepID=UPI000836A2FD|nr:nuclear transport factor 2 family protein [Nocardia miyunensis]